VVLQSEHLLLHGDPNLELFERCLEVMKSTPNPCKVLKALGHLYFHASAHFGDDELARVIGLIRGLKTRIPLEAYRRMLVVTLPPRGLEQVA
jgi:hypothetical protein